jgi:uncharacterized protein
MMKLHRKDATPKGMQHKEFSFKAGNVSDAGTFTGYLSVFGTEDQGGDIVLKGAFADWIKSANPSVANPVPFLWQHRSGEPVGGLTKFVEDDYGLNVEGFLLVDDVARAKEAHALMRANVVRGMSIGYMVMPGGAKAGPDGVRMLTKLALAEGSLVTFPMHVDAQIDSVKSIIQAGKLPSLPEFEKFLCEAGGFSKSQAKAIAGNGLTKLLRSESDSKSSVLDILNNFKLTP